MPRKQLITLWSFPFAFYCHLFLRFIRLLHKQHSLNRHRSKANWRNIDWKFIASKRHKYHKYICVYLRCLQYRLAETVQWLKCRLYAMPVDILLPQQNIIIWIQAISDKYCTLFTKTCIWLVHNNKTLASESIKYFMCPLTCLQSKMFAFKTEYHALNFLVSHLISNFFLPKWER